LLPLDGITILTVIPKWMPTVSKWPNYFAAFEEAGYNMLHFAPMNKRGESNSPYSIFDQLSLSDDLFGTPLNDEEKEKQMAAILERGRNEFGLLSCTDIVWNHTASNSAWLQDHPEAGYSVRNSPHLRPAYELEEALLQFSDDVVQKYGKPAKIESEHDLQGIMDIVRQKIVPRVELWEFYVVHVAKAVELLRQSMENETGPLPTPEESRYAKRQITQLSLKAQAELLKADALRVTQSGQRFGKTVDIAIATEFVEKMALEYNDQNIESKLRWFEAILNEMNVDFYREHDDDIRTLLENIHTRARYLRVDQHGPRLGALSRENPLVDVYFTRLPKNQTTQGRHPEDLALANNGWIWNADPLVNFATSGSKAYLRREVIAWSDCVKLRYGDKPDDNPWLWEHQMKYTQKMSKLFNGLRIDNCHSTPIHVASTLLDAGRKVNPNLYVFAELFSGSEEKDILFVRKLGINSLIREAMNAWDPQELSRLVHRYGGQGVGSLTFPPEHFPLDMLGHDLNSSTFSCNSSDNEIIVDVKGSRPHALLMDCTHDNETPHQKRTAVDTLPNAAIVAMSSCAVGSVMGYDEIVPTLLNLVTESRKYRVPDFQEGISAAKALLYNTHVKMAREGFSEIHVHQEHDFLSIHRVHPVTHQGYLLITRSAFHRHYGSDGMIVPDVSTVHSPIILRNQTVHVTASATLNVQANTAMFHSFDHPRPEFRQTYGYISGIPSTLTMSTTVTTKVHVREECFGAESDMQSVITINRDEFIPGSIVLLFTAMQTENDEGGNRWPPGLWDAVKNLELEDINVALYRSAEEEQDLIGEGVYDVPGHGRLAYAGLQGIVSALQPVARHNDLSHPVFGNLRTGPWLPDYIATRIQRHLYLFPALKKYYSWLHARLTLVRKISPSFSPKYFTFIVFMAYHALRFRALSLDSGQKAIRQLAGNRQSSLESFSNALSMMTCQLYGRVASTGLVPAAYPNQPITESARALKNQIEDTPRDASLAAGLPHFATQYMRCWGRDIFISLPGALIKPGHFDAAKAHLVAFGSTMRHGLIPNLLDQGISPRFNARDAAWWWLYGVAQYCRASPEGYAFLGVIVPRRFIPLKRYRHPDYLGCPQENDDGMGDTYCAANDMSRAYVHQNTIAELCHEILERHAHGIAFREHNAGSGLDHAMRYEGFDVQAFANFENGGLVCGGSRWNCGTWMDKMGDSEKAGTRGTPATPRDGAAVEIVGLAKAALSWVVKDILGAGKGREWWKWEDVVVKGPNDTQSKVTYAIWNSMLSTSFEKHFYIPTDPSQDAEFEIPDRSLVHRRGMYRDTVLSSREFMGFQLRPNFCIAMVVAPDLFEPSHARQALELVREVLVGPLGIKTLDPKDWAYRGTYDNSNDSSDATVAHGFNYHQGPEWVYPLGFFLRAYLYFNTRAEGYDPSKVEHVKATIQRILLKHKEHILDSQKSPWAGLPELTNENGAFCSGSCPTQAWSGALLTELMSELGDDSVLQ
ncbi:glucanotransferase domain of glycogen debranching enzyme-domain-containing protein, partial [Phlyctochytrium arcticum]